MILFLLLTLPFHAPLLPKHFSRAFSFKGKNAQARALVCLFSRFLRKKANIMQCLNANPGIMRDIFRKNREKHHAKARALRIFFAKTKSAKKMLRDKGRVKIKVKSKSKSKVKTLGAIPQTPFFF
ncbi:MAG: hypothetical protein H7829_16730 [Magnetococcus sp. THC-1_WYH]